MYMKVSVSIIFPTAQYKKGGFKHLIEYLAKEYNSTGSLIWMKGDKPYLHCVTSVTKVENLILDCFWYGSKEIEIKIFCSKLQ
jgi:hypothetical protein